MEISAVNGLTGAPAPGDRGVDSLKSEDFFRILISELQQQDPLSPSDTSDLVAQVSQIRSIELSGQLTSTLDALSQQQKASDASNLVGRFVQAVVVDQDGAALPVEGVVTAVRFDTDGSTVLELDTGDAVRASDVLRITTLDALASGLSAVPPGLATAPTTGPATDAASGPSARPPGESAAALASDAKDGATQRRLRRPSPFELFLRAG